MLFFISGKNSTWHKEYEPRGEIGVAGKSVA
jgi:hypothetical protein